MDRRDDYIIYSYTKMRYRRGSSQEDGQKKCNPPAPHRAHLALGDAAAAATTRHVAWQAPKPPKPPSPRKHQQRTIRPRLAGAAALVATLAVAPTLAQRQRRRALAIHAAISSAGGACAVLKGDVEFRKLAAPAVNWGGRCGCWRGGGGEGKNKAATPNKASAVPPTAHAAGGEVVAVLDDLEGCESGAVGRAESAPVALLEMPQPSLALSLATIQLHAAGNDPAHLFPANNDLVGAPEVLLQMRVVLPLFSALASCRSWFQPPNGTTSLPLSVRLRRVRFVLGWRFYALLGRRIVFPKGTGGALPRACAAVQIALSVDAAGVTVPAVLMGSAVTPRLVCSAAAVAAEGCLCGVAAP